MTIRFVALGCLTLLFIACKEEMPPRVTARVLVEGLINPIGLAQLPDGGLLIAEMGTGENDNSAGVSLVTADGQAGRLISGLPSSRDSGDLAGAPLVGISPAGDRIYVGNFNATHLWTLELGEQLALPAIPLTTDDLGTAMAPMIIDQLVNPFDITFDDAGLPVVSDASMNGVARQTAEGKTHFIHLFSRLPHPTDDERTIDPVPTGITRIGTEYYVTLTGGCPFPAGGGQLVAIGQTPYGRQVLTGLNMPIDVAQDAAGHIWVLEFARFRQGGDCFSGNDYLPNSGRLSRLDENGQPVSVLTGLNNPGAFLLAGNDTVFISEVFAGRVLEVHLDFDTHSWPVNMAGIERDDQTLTSAPIPIATLTPRFPTQTEDDDT
jgi:hypothetical protein